MKTDLTDLSLEDQIRAVADRLRELVKCGLTGEPDLSRHFKHRSFRLPAQRAWHFKNLTTAALLLLNGRKAEFETVLAAMRATAVIFEPGDRVIHDQRAHVVKEILPEGKLLLRRGEGTSVALAVHCVAAGPSVMIVSDDIVKTPTGFRGLGARLSFNRS